MKHPVIQEAWDKRIYLRREGDRIYCDAVIEKYGQRSVIDWETGEIEVKG